MKASEVFIEALKREGVDTIFGVPGEENLAFLDAMRGSGIELILTRHEQGAAFMAATYGRMTGKTGVCLATLGPGATNFVTAAAYAQLGGFPMLMITGQKPVKNSKQGHFQIVDVVSMLRPLTKFTHQLVHGSTIPSYVREAFRLAEEERPGATHLELPEDIADEEVSQPIYYQSSNANKPSPNEEALQTAARWIKEAKMPLLAVGGGTNRHNVSTALHAFVDAVGIYFFNTQMGKGALDGRHECFLGTCALSDDDYLHCAISRADLIINVGHDVVEKPPFFMHEDGAKVIHINFSSAVVDPVYFPQLEVVGDVATSLNHLSKLLKGQVSSDNSYFNRVRAEVKKSVIAGQDDGRFPMFPNRIVADVRKVMPSDGVIALDNGVYKIWFARNYQTHEQNTVLLDNALATMGAGLPSAMEVARLYPDRRVMSICGDGGFMMNCQEMETAVRLNLNLVVMVWRDDAYGMIRWKQEGMGLADFGLEYGNPDFIKFTESFGAKGHRVTHADELIPILESCFTSGGVHLVDVPVDYSDNVRILITELKEKVCLI